MKAVGLYRYLPIEHPDSLVDVELPAPTPSGRDVLVEVILCLSSTDQYFPAFASLIKPQGRICAIVSTQRPVELAPLMAKSVTFVWELMFTRPTFQTDDMHAQHDLLNEAARSSKPARSARR